MSKLFNQAEAKILQNYQKESCEKDPEQYVRDYEYYRYYPHSLKRGENAKRIDISGLLANSTNCDDFQEYLQKFGNSEGKIDPYKLKWGSANLLKDENNKVCYLDLLHKIYNTKSAEFVFDYHTTLRNVLNTTGYNFCKWHKKSPKNSKMGMTSRKITRKNKTSRKPVRKTSKKPVRKTSKKPVRKTSR